MATASKKNPSSRKNGASIFRFVASFLFLLICLSAILQLDLVQRWLVQPHLRQIAEVSGYAVRRFGTACEVQDTSVLTDRFSIDIVQGCDSIYPTAMFLAAIFAFPATWSSKIWGALAGTTLLFVVNILRIVTTLYAGRAFPWLFSFIHLYAWQAIFIVLTLSLWLIWASRYGYGKP